MFASLLDTKWPEQRPLLVRWEPDSGKSVPDPPGQRVGSCVHTGDKGTLLPCQEVSIQHERPGC